ncbi:MAG: sigma 54-interacting transcriptional regulator [Polyangiaceae bacterium]|nr:sigma 54-interacting transcriptional regulator [Polyangiaceae bacterium]
MKARELRLDELVTFEKGRISLHGRRLVLHSMDAMAQFRRDLVDLVGPDQARRVLTRFGFFSGQADAAAMRRIYPSIGLHEWLRSGASLHSLMGVTRAVVRALELPDVEGRFFMEVTWHESGEAEEHLTQFGRAREPSCWMMVGYASGYASYCLGKPVFFMETRCRAAGAQVCSAIGRDEASWGGEIGPHRAFFKADDIKSRIRDLTRALRAASRELSTHRKRLAELEALRAGLPVEVHSRSFGQTLEVATRTARFDTSLFITGESGVGKEVLSRYIHQQSPRRSAPFVAINCGALPDTLLESELFGHTAGAFTGARGERVGLFEEAAGGTVFLDEIGETSPATQVKLLRVLQEREVLRLGENVPRKIDVRVIAATNRDIHQALRDKRLREDLYYRLAVVEIRVPPLRERRDDILPLARHFVQRFAEKQGLGHLTLHASCADLLLNHDWPGNVRELENAIEHAAVLCTDGIMRPEHLPVTIRVPRARLRTAAGGRARSLAEVEAEHVEAVLELTQGNKGRAAEILGIGGATLWRRLKKQARSKNGVNR